MIKVKSRKLKKVFFVVILWNSAINRVILNKMRIKNQQQLRRQKNE